jgi:hypothetical protein
MQTGTFPASAIVPFDGPTSVRCLIRIHIVLSTPSCCVQSL